MLSNILAANRASSKVPDVILEAAKFGISEADNDNLADGTVPLPRFEALRLVNDAPDPSVLSNVPEAFGKITST